MNAFVIDVLEYLCGYVLVGDVMSMVVLSLRMRIPKIVITQGPANVIRLEKVGKSSTSSCLFL